MTREEREEAIKRLKKVKSIIGLSVSEKMSLDMAIKALEQEPCPNAINRSDMLDVVGHGRQYTSEELQKIIKGLPSVNPQSCDDAKSRQAVLDIVDSYSESQSNVEDVTQDIISDIMALPPVNPQEPKWILVSERLPEADESGKTFLVTDVLGKLHLSKFYFPLSNSDVDEPYWSGMIDVVAWMPFTLYPFDPQEREE